MPPRIVSTRVISEDKLRATAAVSTGKLETPESTKHPAATALERRNCGDEFRPVRQVEIVNVFSNAGLDDAIGPCSIGLKGAARIDENLGAKRSELGLDATIAVECRRLQPCPGRGARFAKSTRLFKRAARDDQGQARVVLQQRDDAAAERSISAKHEDREVPFRKRAFLLGHTHDLTPVRRWPKAELSASIKR